MSDLKLVHSYSGRPRVGLPSTRYINFIVESSPGGPSPLMGTTRPGLDTTYSLGDGPVLRMNQIPGVFNGDLFTISGGNLYRNSTSVSAVPYGNNPRMAAANGQLAIVVGGALYVYQNNALTLVEFFDDGVSRLPSFSSVVVLYNIFVFSVAGSTQFFFSRAGDATIINAANFGNAQTEPSPIIEMQVLAEEIYFLKAKAVEIWDFTGNLTAPFAESQGRTYSRGCASQGAVVTNVDNTLIWLADDFSIYRSSNIPIKISTNYIDDRIRACGQSGVAASLAFYLGIEGHALYILNLPTINETYAWDAATKEWARWGSEIPNSTDPGLFIGACSAGQASTGIFVGSYNSGEVYTLDSNTYSDAGQAIKTVASGAILLSGGNIRCNNVALQCVRGGGTNTDNPVVEMRFSDDGGRTWSSWLQSHLGFAGGYTYKAVWRYLGAMSQPGRYFEFSVSDSVPFTIESATFNENWI